MKSDSGLETARQRIANCLDWDEYGRLYQRYESLNLAGLDLEDADLEAEFDLPERGLTRVSLGHLRHLEHLDLTGNQLTRLPACIGNFAALRWLGLNFNRIQNLDGFDGLPGMERLYLRNNPLKGQVDTLSSLSGLVELDLTGCGVSRLPTAFAGLKALEYLGLDVDSLVPDQRAAWKEDGWRTLRHQLVVAQAGGVTVRHLGKVVLVGAQENGKTCLQRALRGVAFEAGLRSTDGMSRERMALSLGGDLIPADKRLRMRGLRSDVIDMTLWDMGGQESYQHTHQMFFTPSAIYLIVTLPRSGGSIQDLDRWIERVKRRTEGRASILVVSTWCKKHPKDASISLERLRERHGDMIRDYMEIDSEHPETLEPLRRRMAEIALQESSNFRHEWPTGWAAVLDELARIREAFVGWDTIRTLGEGPGIREEDELRQIVRTGHMIGALLWREDIPDGEEVVILNPDWLCRAVVRLLEDDVTRQRNGLIRIKDLGRVWEPMARDGTPGYPKSTHDSLVRLMEINELAYRPRGAAERTGTGEDVLVTQMVQAMPDSRLDQIWEEISPAGYRVSERVVSFRKTGSISFEDVQDLVYLLIFRLRDFALDRAKLPKTYSSVHWQNGLLVRDAYGSAARIEKESNGLRIIVRHRIGAGLMHSIVHRIGSRDDDFWNGRGLERVEFIPCGRQCPSSKPGRGLFDIQECLDAHNVGNQAVRCDSCRKHMKVEHLLPDLRESLDPIRELERGDVVTLLQELNARVTTIDRKVDQTSVQIANVRDDLKGQIDMMGDAILDAFTSEWKDGPRLFSLVPIGSPNWDPKSWMTMRFKLTVWCEATRRPVPSFRQRSVSGTPPYRGSVEVQLTREWVTRAKRILTLSRWVLMLSGLGGGAVAGAALIGLGAELDGEDQAEVAKRLKEQEGIFKDLLGALPDQQGGLAEFTAPGSAQDLFAQKFPGSGTPVEDDLKLIRELRELYKKQDPEWGGLVQVSDGKFGRIWAHPNRDDPPAQTT